MPDHPDDFAARLRALRMRLGWSESKVADESGIDPAEISRYETRRRYPTEDNLLKLANALGVDVQTLTVSPRERLPVPVSYPSNPKPIRFDKVCLDNIFLMLGNHTEPLEVTVQYSKNRIRIPTKVRPLYDVSAGKAKEIALKKNFPYFNGPNARLTQVREANTRQLATGSEQRGVVLELGPVSWEEFTVLNLFLDDAVIGKGKRQTIRELFADCNKLYRNSPDLNWCQLSNILTVVMMPITTDGYGLIQLRNSHGVSAAGGLFTSGVAENIHRYLDEAQPDDLGRRVNPLGTASSRPVGEDYQPAADHVPSPLLTAQRGLYEEISEELYWRVRTEHYRFLFMNIIIDLKYFTPLLVGVIELGCTMQEAQKLIQEFPGRDHSESNAIYFVRLDGREPSTVRLVTDNGRWHLPGLSALITGIRFWETKHRPV